MKKISDKRDEQRALLEKIGDALDDGKRHLDRLWKLHEREFGRDDEYVRDGSFTEAGRRRLRDMLAEDKMRNAEIAEFFGVTDSAISYHRKRHRRLEALNRAAS